MKNDDIKGLNVKKGLSLVANNKKLYIKLLNSFVSNAFCDQLMEAIDSGDTEMVMRRAHAYKGVAGNMQMDEIYELSQTIETIAKNGVPVRATDAIVSRLIGATAETLESVRMLIDNPGLLDSLE